MGESFNASDLMQKMESKKYANQYEQPNLFKEKVILDAFSAIQKSHDEVEEAFNKLTNKWKRKAVKQFINGEVVQKVEEAVLKQYEIATTSDKKVVREDALKKVGEGMDYWKRIILKKMEG